MIKISHTCFAAHSSAPFNGLDIATSRSSESSSSNNPPTAGSILEAWSSLCTSLVIFRPFPAGSSLAAGFGPGTADLGAACLRAGSEADLGAACLRVVSEVVDLGAASLQAGSEAVDLGAARLRAGSEAVDLGAASLGTSLGAAGLATADLRVAGFEATMLFEDVLRDTRRKSTILDWESSARCSTMANKIIEDELGG